MWRAVTVAFIITLVITALDGCSYHYAKQTSAEWMRRLELSDHHDVYRQRRIAIPVQSHVCVGTALSRQDESLRRRVAEQTYLSLSTFLPRAELIENPQSSKASLKSAYTKRCDFLLYPQIVKKIDKVSSFVEIDDADEETIDVGFDRQWLQLALWDVNSDSLVDLAVIKSRSKLLTFQPHQPEDLLQDSLAVYMKQLVAANNE